MRDWRPLAGLPPAARWAALGVLAVLVILAGVAGAWAVVQHRAATARQGFVLAAAVYRDAMGGADAAQLGAAETALKEFLKAHPRAADAPVAWYALGNVEYRRGAYQAAIAAFGEAARDTGSIGTLSRLGMGYAWEAEKQPARALEAYQQGLQGRDPKQFLYAELLLGVARAQEQLQQQTAAIETYRRLLREVPDTPRAEEVRARLAILGAAAA